jgi:hypothetical protein
VLRQDLIRLPQERPTSVELKVGRRHPEIVDRSRSDRIRWKNEEWRAALGLGLAFGGSEDSGVGLRRLAHVAMVQAANLGDLDDPARLGALDGPDVRRILVMSSARCVRARW